MPARGVLILWILLGWTLHAASNANRFAVLGGTTDHAQAQRIADSARKLLQEKNQFEEDHLQIQLHKVQGLWLVELGPLPRKENEIAPLLLTLRQQYPGTLLLPGDKAGQEMHGISVGGSTLRIGKWSIRLEWIALLLITLVGTLWLSLRARRLGRLENEQRRMEYRQQSIRARLNPGKGRE